MTVKKRSRHRQERFLFVLMGLILIGLLVAGYFIFREHFAGSTDPAAKAPGKTGKQANAAEINAALFPDGEGQMVTLFFGARGKDFLVKETRKVAEEKMVLTQAKNLLRELIRGPFEESSRPVLPPGTQVRSLFYHAGVFLADFSSELSDNHSGGALEETLTIFSIVNTLTELDPKARVRILINGQERETLRGHVGLDQPFSRYEPLAVDATRNTAQPRASGS